MFVNHGFGDQFSKGGVLKFLYIDVSYPFCAGGYLFRVERPGVGGDEFGDQEESREAWRHCFHSAGKDTGHPGEVATAFFRVFRAYAIGNGYGADRCASTRPRRNGGSDPFRTLCKRSGSIPGEGRNPDQSSTAWAVRDIGPVPCPS